VQCELLPQPVRPSSQALLQKLAQVHQITEQNLQRTRTRASGYAHLTPAVVLPPPDEGPHSVPLQSSPGYAQAAAGSWAADLPAESPPTEPPAEERPSATTNHEETTSERSSGGIEAHVPGGEPCTIMFLCIICLHRTGAAKSTHPCECMPTTVLIWAVALYKRPLGCDAAAWCDGTRPPAGSSTRIPASCQCTTWVCSCHVTALQQLAELTVLLQHCRCCCIIIQAVDLTVGGCRPVQVRAAQSCRPHMQRTQRGARCSPSGWGSTKQPPPPLHHHHHHQQQQQQQQQQPPLHFLPGSQVLRASCRPLSSPSSPLLPPHPQAAPPTVLSLHPRTPCHLWPPAPSQSCGGCQWPRSSPHPVHQLLGLPPATPPRRTPQHQHRRRASGCHQRSHLKLGHL
jgi:hypothetical protein